MIEQGVGETDSMLALQAAATTLLAFGAALAATYLRGAEFFQHPLLSILGLPAGIVMAVMGCILLGIGARSLRRRFDLPDVALELWICRNCSQTNEGSLKACWSCGLPYQLPRGTPTHIPAQSRWRCSRCRVWNGILRSRCWFCGLEHKPALAAGKKRKRRRGPR
jgi:hypothetical protein